jgi:pimeloyl-ACP methyl ester carboxylesterase
LYISRQCRKLASRIHLGQPYNKSWYLLATEDKMIPPPAQRFMSERAGATVTEVAASHSVFVSQPAAVAALIKQAASTVAARQ